MNDSYSRTSNHLFFDFNDKEEVKDAIEVSSYVLKDLINQFIKVSDEIAHGDEIQSDFTYTVLLLFIRKIIEQLDAINILFSFCSFVQAQVILRSLFENIVSLEFILKEDTEERAAAYWLEERYYKKIDIYKEISNEKSEYYQNIVEYERIEGVKILNEFKEKCENESKKIENYIKGLVDSNNPIFTKISKNRKKQKGTYVKWYRNCSNIQSIKQMMEKVGYGKYYKGIYGELSSETHACKSTMDITFDEDFQYTEQMRRPINGDMVISLSCDISTSLLRNIYGYLKHGEEQKNECQIFFEDFGQKKNNAVNRLEEIDEIYRNKITK